MTKYKPEPDKKPEIELTPRLLELAIKLKDPNLTKIIKKFEEVFRKPPTQRELLQYAKWVLSASFEWTLEDSKNLQKMNFEQEQNMVRSKLAGAVERDGKVDEVRR